MFVRITFLALTLFCTAWSAEREGVRFPDTQVVSGKTLLLNGLGVREATIFKVDVYVAALYLQKKCTTSEEALAQPGPKQIDMQFVRDVGKEDLTKAWKEGFDKNCAESCQTLLPALNKLNTLMTEIKKGQRMSFIFYKDKVTVGLDGKSLGIVEGTNVSPVLMRLWIGQPPNAGLKAGLLGSE